MIGILAGMGPKSTAPFIDQVVTTYQKITGVIHDIDFPPMLIYSLPTPFYLDRPIDHALMRETICNGLKKLETCGASFIAMPCNSAHAYFGHLRHCTRIPFLNMIEETLARIPKDAKKITLFGTRTTLESGIYQTGVLKAGLEFAFHLSWQDEIDLILRQIKASSELPLVQWRKLYQSAQNENIDAILLVCTDLNPLLAIDRPACTMIDSSASLAEATVQKWLNYKSS